MSTFSGHHTRRVRTLHDVLWDKLERPMLSSGRSSYATAPLITPQQDEFILYVECAATLLYDMKRSNSATDIVVSCSTFFRSLTGSSVTGTVASIFTKLAEELSDKTPFWQDSSWIDTCDDFHKNLHRVRGSTLGRKLISVFNHVIAHTFYHKMGIEVDGKLYSHIEKGYIHLTVWTCLTFADAIVGLLIFLAKAGRQALLTGSVEPFFVDSAFISDWLLRANRLRKDAEFLGNPQAIGLDTPTYLGEIADAIEDGHKLAKMFGDTQRMLINGVVIELEMVQKRHQSSLAASSFRFCPVGINLYGDSGVGKSFIAKGLFNHYASVRGVDPKRATLYPRNPDDKYYSGFKSSHLGIIFDDVAKHKANKVLGIDQSLADIISVGNNIPLITNQAEVHDKGKIPLLCEWMGITSNIKDLNVSQYYNNTYAVLRRMPYRIEPIVKPAFVKPGTTQLDPALVPEGVQYPDCWIFHVCKVRKHDADSLLGYYEDQGTVYQSFSELLHWLTRYYQEHIDNQTRLMTTVNNLGPETLCRCALPRSLCACNPEEEGLPMARGPMLFGDVPVELPEAQADMGKAERMMGAIQLRRKLIQKHSALKGLEKLNFEQLMATDYHQFMHEHIDEVAEETLGEMEEAINANVDSFSRLCVKTKVMFVANSGMAISDADDYLTFTPQMGGKRNSMRAQLKWVYDYILKYVSLAGWNDAQMAALEAFVYQKVPQYLIDGWDDESLLQGAYDFVDKYAGEFDPTKKTLASELLMSDLESAPSLRDRVCRFLGMQYFTRPWVFTSVNYAANTRVGKWVGEKCVGQTPMSAARTLADLGDVYDTKLKGKHPLVVMLITVCASSVVVMLIKFVVDRFKKPAGQLDLNLIGKKPVVREAEKINVWTVQERNLTALDFQPRRPNNMAQITPGVATNSVLAEIYSPNVARATTRVLVIDNHTILMNNHATFDSFQLTLYYGRKVQEGVQSKIVVEVEASMIRRIPERDLAIITTMALPALFKNISSHFAKKSCTAVGPSFYHVPGKMTPARTVDVIGVRREFLGGFAGDAGGVNMQALTGTVSVATQAGECGSPLIVTTPFGPIIGGIHCAYNAYSRSSHAAPVFYEDFEHRPMVQVGVVTPAVEVVAETCAQVKMYTDYHQDGQMIVFGALKGFRPRPKANGTYTEIAHAVMAEAPSVGLTIEDRLTTPDMGSWEPQQNILKEYLVPTHSMREPVWRTCCDSFIRHVTTQLTANDIADVHVVPLSVAVNGFPGVPNVDAQKFNTSSGHGFPGCKRTYVISDEPFEEWTSFKTYDEKVIAEVERIFELAKQGIRSHPIFTAQLKDEMVSLAKREAKKTRGFYMCPLAFLTAMRIVTTGLTRVMVRRRKLFRHAVGLNTHSEEWHELHLSSAKIPGDNWMAGDFKGFDKILSILIQNGAKHVILGICEYCGFNEEEIMVLDTLLCDNITAVVDFFGTLIMLMGGEVSGHQLTTFFNSICNVLLHLYCYTVIALEHGCEMEQAADEFWSTVFICVLGDDIMAKVSPIVPWYNHTTVQNVFASIGITYTMADKHSESVPYISQSEVGFLKRKFAGHELFPGMMVAPLDKESIYKMLIYTQPSKTVSKETQLAMSICSALSEAFYHGKEFYDKISWLVEVAPKTAELDARMSEYPAPSWYQCYERFLTASPNYRVLLVEPGLQAETAPTLSDSYCHESAPHAQTSWSVDCWGSTTMERSSEEPTRAEVRLSLEQRAWRRRVEKNEGVENLHLSKQHTTQTNTTDSAYGQMAPAVVVKAISKVRTQRLRKDKRLKWENRPVAQSEIRADTEGAQTTAQQMYSFKDEPTSVTVDMRAKSNWIASKMSLPQTLGDYFQRPRLISTFTWTEAMTTGTQATISPWQLYLGDPSLREKMGGFGLFRGNLHLKFTVNGSPFYYGGLMAAYTPLISYRGDTVGTVTNLALVANSQKPHVWLNVQNTSSADLILPFLYPFPYAETTAAAYTGLGKLDFVVYAGLQSANGVTGSAVDVQVFAWIEDLELAGPTNQPVSQADIEYKSDGQISAPLAAVAAGAKKLSDVPIIGPYAMATSTVAGALGKFAGALGFTNVPNVSDISPMRQLPFELASTQISAPLTKLSLQPKAETAVGASQHGGGMDDELNIKRFAGRQSFLVGSTWTTSLVPGDVLFTSSVTPGLRQKTTASGIFAQAFPPMGYVGQAFQYWRGTIRFTFKMIRSKYHRGRIQIGWDRNANNLNEGASLGNTNTMTTIMDLDETDEVSFDVPYVQAKQFLQTVTTLPATADQWSTDLVPPNLGTVGNGVINVRVLNRLTAPEASSNATMLIFVSGGDDIEFAGPRNLYSPNTGNFTTLSPLVASVAQSDIQYEEQVSKDSHDAPHVDPAVYREVFGEKVASLRDYLHRSSLAKSFVLSTAATGSTRWVIPLKHMPPSPGVFNNAFELITVTGSQYANICPQHPLPWFAACFAGFKGSVNITANVMFGEGAISQGYADSFTIDRVPDGASLDSASRRINSFVVGTGNTYNANVLFKNQVRPGVSGKALTNTRTNASLVANLPYYNNAGFYVADLQRTYNNQDSFSGGNDDWWELTLQAATNATTAAANQTSVDVYYGTGPDFDTVFFVNVPIVYLISYTT